MMLEIRNPFDYPIKVVSPDFAQFNTRLAPGGSLVIKTPVPEGTEPFIKPLMEEKKQVGIYIAVVADGFQV